MICISGVGCVLPTGIGVQDFWHAASESITGIEPLKSDEFFSHKISHFGHIKPEHTEHCWKNVPSNMQRYTTRETSWGLDAVRQALSDAQVETNNSEKRFGLYTCQGGYTHPSLSTYRELLEECREPQGLNKIKLSERILRDRVLDPFLVIKSLTNGLMGVISLALKLEAECGSYMEGISGNHAAIQQAYLALNENRIDVAIVVGAGSELDLFALSKLVQAGIISTSSPEAFIPFDFEAQGGIAGEGAVAFILQRKGEVEASQNINLQPYSTSAEINCLSLTQMRLDLITSSGFGLPTRDFELCDTLKKIDAKAISSSQPLTGVLSAAPSFAEILFTHQAIVHQKVPPIAGLRHPVDTGLPFAVETTQSHSIRSAGVLSVDGRGANSFYRLSLN